MKELYDMKLHEHIIFNSTDTVTRVPGGWIYAACEIDRVSQCFVPFNREFDEEHQKLRVMDRIRKKKGGSNE